MEAKVRIGLYRHLRKEDEEDDDDDDDEGQTLDPCLSLVGEI
jgi:hypothetical protein